ncbi:unnamed protein product, partial [Discosporangium mesarthrocarpum]
DKCPVKNIVNFVEVFPPGCGVVLTMERYHRAYGEGDGIPRSSWQGERFHPSSWMDDLKEDAAGTVPDGRTTHSTGSGSRGNSNGGVDPAASLDEARLVRSNVLQALMDKDTLLGTSSEDQMKGHRAADQRQRHDNDAAAVAEATKGSGVAPGRATREMRPAGLTSSLPEPVPAAEADGFNGGRQGRVRTPLPLSNPFSPLQLPRNMQGGSVVTMGRAIPPASRAGAGVGARSVGRALAAGILDQGP